MVDEGRWKGRVLVKVKVSVGFGCRVTARLRFRVTARGWVSIDISI